jgi:hypothetical protein
MRLESRLISVRAYQLCEQERRPHDWEQIHCFDAEPQLQEVQRGSLVETRPASQSSRRGRGRR